jgi:hypothetical protein
MASHLGVDPTHPVRPLNAAATRKVITSLNATFSKNLQSNESPLYHPSNWRHSSLGDALEQLEKFVLVHVGLTAVMLFSLLFN